MVKLRKLKESDTEHIVKWRNSTEVKKNLYSQDELTAQQHLNYFHNVVQKGKCSQYIISVENDKDTFDIGTTFIKNIDHDNSKGEFGIFIGEKKGRGKGYAKHAVSEMLKIAFNELNLNRVYLYVYADNVAAIKSYISAGFSQEGILREDHNRNGIFVDIIVMGILKSEFEDMISK